MDTKHTPEPWWDESGVAHAKAPDWTPQNHACIHPIANQNGKVGDCSRACACVSACAGINPEAVPDLLAALEAIGAGFQDGSIKFTKPRQADSDPYHPANVLMCAAFAKARGY